MRLPALVAVVFATLLACVPSFAASRTFDDVAAGLLPGRWIEVHRQAPGDEVVFRRQAHGGSAFDTRRGRIVLFGSDTHGEDWTNSPLYFDVATLTWRRAYADDAPSTYRVSATGLPIAGRGDIHPWAMHTFGAVTYDPAGDQLIVASYPAHLEPGRHTDALQEVWPQVRQHPTWLFDLGSERWRPLEAPAVHFFPHATAFDTDRRTVVGYRPDGIYELPLGEPTPAWHKVSPALRHAYHINLVYDSWRRQILIAGSHQLSNEILIYDPARRRERVMSTPGVRPPPFQHAPMAFHERKGVVVVIADRITPPATPAQRQANRAETWIYDPSADRWTHLPGADFPYGLGMNYNLHYNRLRDVLLLVADAPDGPTSVWALRLD